MQLRLRRVLAGAIVLKVGQRDSPGVDPPYVFETDHDERVLTDTQRVTFSVAKNVRARTIRTRRGTAVRTASTSQARHSSFIERDQPVVGSHDQRLSSRSPSEGAGAMNAKPPTADSAALGLPLVSVVCLFPACGRDAQAMTPSTLEQQYGVAGGYTGTVTTAEGSIKGTVVPVTLADGRTAQLVIPAHASNDPHGLYMHDGNGLHPVKVSDRASRADVTRAPSVVETRPEPSHAEKRSWEKDA